jgi:hypothetical protein
MMNSFAGRAPLTRPGPAHISPKIGRMAIAFIWLRFWPINLDLLISHSFGEATGSGWGRDASR